MDECPLCGIEFDETDKNFKPCPCNYRVCSFCFNKLINDKEIDPLCPACRQPYNLKKIKFTPPPNSKLVPQTKIIKKKKKKVTKDKEEILIKNRKELENMRVLQRNLVYITNIPLSLAKEEILKKHEYFGQYGNITKIVVNKGKYFNTTAPGGPSVSAYVTFDKKRLEDTYLCILAVDGCWLENRTLRASYGTTKYCSYFLKNITCTNSNCMYLHSLGRKEDSFTKEEMTQGKHLVDTTFKLDFNLIPKPTKPSILPPPGVIAKELPKDKRKKGYFDPNEKKDFNIKPPNTSDLNDKTVDELTDKIENTTLKEEKEEEEFTSEGEEEDGSDQEESDQFQQSSEENRNEEISFSEKIKKKKLYYQEMNRYNKKPLQRRKPSGEVEDEPIILNLSKSRKHSENQYESTKDYGRGDINLFRKYSDVVHDKPKKFESNFSIHMQSKLPPPPIRGYPKPGRSDGNIFTNEEDSFSHSIWSKRGINEEYNNRIPPFQEPVENPYMVNPGFHYGYPPINPNYEDERGFSKHPNYQNYPNFQNHFYKQKPSAPELYWNGYPPQGFMYPNQFHPSMGYHPGFNYPNYQNYPNFVPPMFQTDQIPQTNPQQQINPNPNSNPNPNNIPNTNPIPNNNTGNNVNNTNTKNSPPNSSNLTNNNNINNINLPPNTNNLNNPVLNNNNINVPPNTNLNYTHKNPVNPQVPLFYTQGRNSLDSAFHMDHLNRNYQQMYIPPHLQHNYPNPIYTNNPNFNYLHGQFLTNPNFPNNPHPHLNNLNPNQLHQQQQLNNQQPLHINNNINHNNSNMNIPNSNLNNNNSHNLNHPHSNTLPPILDTLKEEDSEHEQLNSPQLPHYNHNPNNNNNNQHEVILNGNFQMNNNDNNQPHNVNLNDQHFLNSENNNNFPSRDLSDPNFSQQPNTNTNKTHTNKSHTSNKFPSGNTNN